MKRKNRTTTFVLVIGFLIIIFLGTGKTQPGASAFTPDKAVQQEKPPRPLPTEKEQGSLKPPSDPSDSLEAGTAGPIDANYPSTPSFPDTMSLEADQITARRPLSANEPVVNAPAAPDAWTTITSEDFEGIFPGPGWVAFDDDGTTNGEYYWGDDSFKAHNGSWSGWPANDGIDGYSSSAGNYPHNALSWFVYGPFNLSDAVAAELQFYYWLDTEPSFDYFGWYASTDGTNFSGYHTSGNSGGWLAQTFDLTTVPTLGDVTGETNVWIAFVFTSDSSVNDYAGPFIDDILLQKDGTSSGVNLAPYTPSGWDNPLVPSSTTGTYTVNDLYALTDTYIDWAVVNWGPDDIAQTFYTCLYFDGSAIQCWYNDGLPNYYYSFVEDWILNVSPGAGWHTLEMFTDVYDDVPETNENDNYWGADFYWNDSGYSCAAAISEFENTLGGTTIPSTDNPAPNFMPPHPDLLERARLGKIQLPEFITNPDYKQARGIDQPSGPALGPSGQWRALALLVEFTDNPSAVGAAYYDSLLFGTNFGDLRDYYQDVSYGTLDIVTVNLPSSLGWCMMPQTYAYYVDGNNGFNSYPRNAQKMAEDAVLLADPLVDFSQYDNDNDGWVDTVFIIHSGPGAEFTGDDNDIWSHSWAMSNDPVVDGVIANGYTSEPEYWLTPGDMTSGVYAHELGHAFGLPDLYDTDYSSSGVGNWSLMAGGSWNGTNGDSPAWLDAWSRQQLGFSSLAYVSGSMNGASIPAAETNSSVLYLSTDSVPGPEHYLVENRQSVGYDAALPGHGLLIWHIDENKSGNQNECNQLNNWNCTNNYLVALEQADGLWDLENNRGRGDSGDPYPGSSNNRNYNFTTTPNSSSYYDSSDTCISVNNISNSAATMTADLKVSCLTDFDDDIFWYAAGPNADYLAKSNGNGTFTFQAKPVGGTYTPLVGNFAGSAATDIFWYAPGSPPDYLWTATGGGSFTEKALSVSGTYEPLLGDFNGDGFTDFFWYAPGPNADWLALSNGSGGFTYTPKPVGGTYTPLVGNFAGSVADDIFWYAPGAPLDYLWTAIGNGNFSELLRSVSGIYTPLLGDFDNNGYTDFFWYAPGPNADWLALSNGSGGFTYTAKPVGGTYTPLIGNFAGSSADDIFWYAPGAPLDYLWTATGSGSFSETGLSVSGTYEPVLGDYNRDGYTDLFWYVAGPGADWVALSNGNGTFAYTQQAIGGTYTPFVGDFDGSAAAVQAPVNLSRERIPKGIDKR